MTYEDKQPRPENKPSNEPYWDNNSPGSSSSEPYVYPPESPYASQGNIEFGSNGKPIPLYNPNEPYWANNPTPYPSTPSPQYSSNGLSPKPYRNPNRPGIPPEELASMRSEAKGPNSPAPEPRETKNSIGLSPRELKELAGLVAKPSTYKEEAHKIANQTDSPSSEVASSPSTSSLSSSQSDLLDRLSPDSGTPLSEKQQVQYSQKMGMPMSDIRKIHVVNIQTNWGTESIFERKSACDTGQK